MIWGGAGNQEKKNDGPSPGKNKFQKREGLPQGINFKGIPAEEIDSFSIPPRSLMVDPLVHIVYICTSDGTIPAPSIPIPA